MCILCTPRSICRSTYRPTLDRCIGRHIGRVSVDMSTDISVDSRSIGRPRCVGRRIDRHIGRTSVDMSTDTRPIYRSICRPRVIVRLSADMSIDRLPTFRRYFTATFPGCLAWNITLERFESDACYSPLLRRFFVYIRRSKSHKPNQKSIELSRAQSTGLLFDW